MTGPRKPSAQKKAGHRSWLPRSQAAQGGHRGDIMSPAKRSALMARIRGRDTKPEQAVAKALTEQGIRFESHPADLPGRPDIVVRRMKVAVFIDGDFWHGWRFPLWQKKLAPRWLVEIEGNRARDLRNFRKLRRLGWKVIRTWEHQIEQDLPRCVERIAEAVQQRTVMLKRSGITIR
jgi:DNA mismatch endonuclease (patch repair protein)